MLFFDYLKLSSSPEDLIEISSSLSLLGCLRGLCIVAYAKFSDSVDIKLISSTSIY